MAYSVQTACIFLLIASVYPSSATSLSFGHEESINPPPIRVADPALLERGVEGATSRASDFTHKERGVLIATHNNFRRSTSPPAADMNALVWDSDLAAMAQGWSDQCLFAHGNPENISPFSSVGQNLFIQWSSKANPAAPGAELPVRKWNDEAAYYTYSSGYCTRVCAHYKQVVWAKTTHVGCGKTLCPEATNGEGKTYKNAWIVTCNYGPSGNIKGQKYPYIEGKKCSRCRRDPFTCNVNICKACNLEDDGCTCELECENCGYRNTTDGSCKCTCPKGFWGDNCQNVCEDTHHYCGSSPGWPYKSYCKEHPSIPNHCPLFCGRCEAADPDFVCETGGNDL